MANDTCQNLWQHLAALVLLASLLSWLMGALRLAQGARGAMKVASAVLLLGFIPLHGISATGLVLSFSPSLSVAGTALWATLLARRMGAGGLDRDIAGIALMVFAVSIAVYVSVIGGIGPDIYDSGYGFTVWDIVLAASAVVAFVRGARIAWLLLACLFAHAAGLLPTSNIFDAIIDGPAFLLSIIVLARIFAADGLSLPKRRAL